jgi:hypothetical protein
MAFLLPIDTGDPNIDIVMLFLGGAHQLFHLAPVAAVLSRTAPDKSVTCITADPHVAVLLADIRQRMNSPRMRIETVQPPRWGKRLAKLFHRHSLEKLALLWSLTGRLSRAATIVTPERTSAWLRIFRMTRARMIHFRHGAGDRAPSSERRLKAFDLIVVAGDKDVERAVQKYRIDRARLRTGGYVKLDYLRHCPQREEKLFHNNCPTILFNPHFERSMSSWDLARAIIEAIRADDRYNLIVAPHIRIAENMDENERTAWVSLAEPDRVIVDLSSDRLIDMTYVRQANIYLGDMSSQLYEFLADPRPAAFINAHGVAWRGDPRYAGWHLGAVAETIDDLLFTIDRAVLEHPFMIEQQREAVRRAFGKIDGACERAAAILIEAMAN